MTCKQVHIAHVEGTPIDLPNCRIHSTEESGEDVAQDLCRETISSSSCRPDSHSTLEPPQTSTCYPIFPSSARSLPYSLSVSSFASLDAATPAPLVQLWKDAVQRYKFIMHGELPSPDVATFDSADAIFKYIEERESDFRRFRERGPRRLRSKIDPIAATVQTLCGVFGEAMNIPFLPAKAIFVAVGVAIQASRKVSEHLDTVMDAFDTMSTHLRIIRAIAPHNMHAALREASVKLLVQILVVLRTITNLQNGSRLRLWWKNIRQSKEIPSALEELGRLATNHHYTVSAVTLNTLDRTMAMHDLVHQRDQDTITGLVDEIRVIHRMVEEDHCTEENTHASLGRMVAQRMDTGVHDRISNLPMKTGASSPDCSSPYGGDARITQEHEQHNSAFSSR